MPRNSKVSTLWYDPETDEEWEATATYNHPRPGTYYDPPEGGDLEDITISRSLNGIPIETLSEDEFVARFGQKAFDQVEQGLFDSSEDLYDDLDCDDRYDLDDDRSPDSFDGPDFDGP